MLVNTVAADEVVQNAPPHHPCAGERRSFLSPLFVILDFSLNQDFVFGGRTFSLSRAIPVLSRDITGLKSVRAVSRDRFTPCVPHILPMLFAGGIKGDSHSHSLLQASNSVLTLKVTIMPYLPKKRET